MKSDKFKTHLGVRFIKSGPGISVSVFNGNDAVLSFGNLYPPSKMYPKVVANVAGQIWETGADLTSVTDLELLQETVRDLPKHIENHSSEQVRTAYVVRLAEEASRAHEINNKVRDQLQHYADLGIIEVVYDTFLDDISTNDENVETDETKGSKRGRPAKV